MKSLVVCAVIGVLSLAMTSGVAAAADVAFQPGAAGIGDPYFPFEGNGGYDVEHYTLDLGYDPSTHHLDGTATIEATATENLSSLNFDFVGLNVLAITVDDRDATWTRDNSELTITPSHGLRSSHEFTLVVRYEGVPQTLDSALGVSGVFPTEDGMVIAGEPDGAATWFPVNDHPLDKAAYTFKVTVPRGVQVVANGRLERKKTRHGHTTFIWQERDPMNSYLATVNVGNFVIRDYRKNGIRFYDAIDPALFEPVAQPTTGTHLLISGQADSSYKRLTRTIAVPTGGASLTFQVTRDTEQNWDFVFVEAHTVGLGDWTTLPDANGHTSTDVGRSCPEENWTTALHPFLAHYQTDDGKGTCLPTGTTGNWNAATGTSDGHAETWKVDLSPYAGKAVEVSISYASDQVVQAHGVFVDDIVSSTGEGTTSFEPDADTMDGWTVPGAPAGSPGNTNDFTVGTIADLPENYGPVAKRAFAREPEILSFLASKFGPYPFRDAGGIVDHLSGVGFALENQTRPVYAQEFFGADQAGADSVVVHELSHQWYGDSVSVHFWQDIWLNEGFATYSEWLWREQQGLGTAQEIFDGIYANIPPDSPFWAVLIGDPGPDLLFDGAIYTRGAMTLHQLRLVVGDEAFFRILRKWASSKRGGNGSIAEFIQLSERISGKDLGTFFTTWLYTAGKPALPLSAALTTTPASSTLALAAAPSVPHGRTHAALRR